MARPKARSQPTGASVGTYIHGLFADDRQRAAWLGRFAAGAANIAYDALVEETLDALAAHLEAHLDIDRIAQTCQMKSTAISASDTISTASARR